MLLGQAPGANATVGFPNDFEDEFLQTLHLTVIRPPCGRAAQPSHLAVKRLNR
jgi:hypothetical protein